MTEQPIVRTAAETALFWQTVKDAVTREYEAARVVALAEMHRAGSEKQRVRDDDGTDLGTLGVGEGRWATEVNDLDTLIKWVADNAETELWRPVQIRPAYMARLSEKVARGEDVPGMRRVWRDGSLTVRPNALAKERTRSRLAEVAAGIRAVELPRGEVGEVPDVPGDRDAEVGASGHLGAASHRSGPWPAVRFPGHPWGPTVTDAPDIDSYDEPEDSGVWSGETPTEEGPS